MSRAASTAPELEYEFDPSLWARVQEHRGKWVAITDDRIVSVEDSPEAALKQAGGGGIESPTLIYVPEDRGASYLL